MTEQNRMEPQVKLRGRFVKWPNPGDSVKGIVTFVDLERRAYSQYGGVIQVYDSSVGAPGFYRRIDLAPKGLLGEVDRCVRSGLQLGWWIWLTYEEYVKNEKTDRYPWKRFKALYAEPTKSEKEVFDLVEGGRLSAQQVLSLGVPTEPYNSGSPSRVGACLQCP